MPEPHGEECRPVIHISLSGRDLTVVRIRPGEALRELSELLKRGFTVSWVEGALVLIHAEDRSAPVHLIIPPEGPCVKRIEEREGKGGGSP